jgi:hypothetical protein
MEAIQFKNRKYCIDITVVDKDEKIILLVEVKTHQKLESEVSQLKSYLRVMETEIPFAMLANLEEIQIFKVRNDNDMQLKISLKTVDILKYYDDKFADKKIYGLYLITLLEAWLRDLAYHWKSEIPPGSEELAKIGLLEKIEGGDTYSQNE